MTETQLLQNFSQAMIDIINKAHKDMVGQLELYQLKMKEIQTETPAEPLEEVEQPVAE